MGTGYRCLRRARLLLGRALRHPNHGVRTRGELTLKLNSVPVEHCTALCRLSNGDHFPRMTAGPGQCGGSRKRSLRERNASATTGGENDNATHEGAAGNEAKTTTGEARQERSRGNARSLAY